ncbi:hypothetical protein D3C76_1412300 [compost metagenome]
MNSTESTNGIGLEVNRAFLNLPIHPSFTLPDFQWLLFGEATAQAMPRRRVYVGHCFDEMSHGFNSL